MASEAPNIEHELPKTFAVPVEFHEPESTVTRLATNITVRADENGYYVAFYEARPPIVTGTPEDVKTRFAEVKSVAAECVARVFVPKDVMPRMLQAIQSMSGIPERLAEATKTPTDKEGQ